MKIASIALFTLSALIATNAPAQHTIWDAGYKSWDGAIGKIIGWHNPTLDIQSKQNWTPRIRLVTNNGSSIWSFEGAGHISGKNLRIKFNGTSMFDFNKNGNITVKNDANMYGLNIVRGYNDLHLQASSSSGTNLSLKTDGNVGVGTSSPTARLDVYSLTNAIKLRAGNGSNGFSRNQMLFSWSGNATYSHAIKTRHNSGATSGNAIDFYLWQPGDGTGAAGSLHTMSLHGGNVGIGITNPTQKLDVNGKVKADGVVLNIGTFPDYVFAPEYELMPLGDLETFVKTNKHLPGIPSESEVVANGADLGLINIKLVEKVEELTLYTINQDKEIKTLTDQLAKMQAQLEQLLSQ